MPFLPITRAEAGFRETDAFDFIVVSADAYVDHPSFGHALIARLVESRGFSVGILPQPVTDEDFMRLGAPKHAFLVSAGVVDSMVNNYHVSLTRRTEDVYSEDGICGKRPDRVTEVYCKALKKLYPQTPVIAGGIEPSLRRLSHYDYWTDSVRHSIVYDAPCDLIVYGMGENPILQICEYAHKNIPLGKVRDIRGTAYLTEMESAPEPVRRAVQAGDQSRFRVISSHDRVCSDKKSYAKAFMETLGSGESGFKEGIIQKQDYTKYAVINPPAAAISQADLDAVYALPFMRLPHPSYRSVPAIEEVQFSVTAHRGCFGNCSFCALTYHQGKRISARSQESVLAEIADLTQMSGFKGYIHDIGGPSANFHDAPCDKNAAHGACGNKDCVGYQRCGNLKTSHKSYLELLRSARKIAGVKKVFIRSGIRFDYLLTDSDKSFLNELAKHHVSGQLKVAPEHVSDKVLKLMNKPPHVEYVRFSEEFARATKRAGKQQYLVPYYISSHPGCTLNDAVKLTEYLMSIHYMPLQVQDFYPTPSTLSTTMYYTELDPRTGESLYVAKTKEDKAMQRALLQYRKDKNRSLVTKAFRICGREDLIKKLPQTFEK